MKQTVIVAAACVMTATASVAVTWRLTARRVDAVRDELEAVSGANSTAIDQLTVLIQAQRTRITELVVSINELRETKTEVRTIAAPPRAPARPTPTARANWWCYFQRECFRDQDDCIAGDAKRADECKPARSAWCGGIDGKACFADEMDCIDLDSKIQAPLMLGASGDSPRPCVVVE